MTTTLKVVGLPELTRTLAQAAKKVPDVDAYDAATAVTADIPGTAPRRTGRLAGSFRPARQGKVATITTPVVYAVPIHWGSTRRNIARNPFVYPAADAAEGRMSAALDKAGQKICDGVRGA